jgi:Ran GTPase-activating protein (RanGAP) involved in mRNA processing and transport
MPNDQGAFDAIIVRLQNNDPTLTVVEFGSAGITDADCGRLGIALQNNKYLQNLALYGNSFGSVGGIAIATALQTNTGLQILNFDYNAIGTAGVNAFANALQINKTLRELYMYYVFGGTALNVTALTNALRVNTELQILDIGGNDIGVNGATAFANILQVNSSLKTLNIANNLMGDTGSIAIAQALQSNASLTQLGVGYNAIGSSGAQAFAQTLMVNTVLQGINLSTNLIDNNGVQALAQSLKFNRSLQNLNINGNLVDSNGASFLAQALQINTALQVLYFSNNAIGDIGAQAFAQMLRINQSLQHLDLWGGNIGDIGASAFAQALQNNHALQVLGLPFNSIGNKGVQAIAALLKTNSSLREIYLHNNPIDDTGLITLINGLLHNYVITTLDLSSNLNWDNLLYMNTLLSRNQQCKGLVNPILQCPVIANNALAIHRGEKRALTENDFLMVDVEYRQTLNGRFDLDSISQGQFLNAQNQIITEFSQLDIANRVIFFQHDNSTIAPYFNITAAYEGLTTFAQQAHIDFLPFPASTKLGLDAIPVIDLAKIPLDGQNGFIIPGLKIKDYNGHALSSGNVNGDKIPDLLIGAFGASPNNIARAGETRLVFGKLNITSDGVLLLNDTKTNSEIIFQGFEPYEASGASAQIISDVNGDDIDDILIGAYGGGESDSRIYNASYVGKVYLIFGNRNLNTLPNPFSLSLLSSIGGITFYGRNPGDHLGVVGDLRDINGDGYNDFFVSSFSEGYVIFGSSNLPFSSINLNQLGGRGFVISGLPARADFALGAAKSVGDINKDGIDDFAISDSEASWGNRTNSGIVYVVFGSRAWSFFSSLSVASLNGSNGFVIPGKNAGDRCGFTVNRVEDITGDGIDDLGITTIAVNAGRGESYIIPGAKNIGQTGILDLNTLDKMTTLIGVDQGERSGIQFTTIGDVNQDGFNDLLIGADGLTMPVAPGTGKAYIVFGPLGMKNHSTFSLSQLNGKNGFTILGEKSGDQFSHDLTRDRGQDLNGDGIPDIFIGAPYADPNGLIDAGKGYIIYGASNQTLSVNVNFPTFVNNQMVILNSNNFQITSSAYASDKIQILVSSLQHGNFINNLTQQSLTSFMLSEVVAGNISFVRDNNVAYPSFTVVVQAGFWQTKPVFVSLSPLLTKINTPTASPTPFTSTAFISQSVTNLSLIPTSVTPSVSPNNTTAISPGVQGTSDTLSTGAVVGIAFAAFGLGGLIILLLGALYLRHKEQQRRDQVEISNLETNRIALERVVINPLEQEPDQVNGGGGTVEPIAESQVPTRSATDPLPSPPPPSGNNRNSVVYAQPEPSGVAHSRGYLRRLYELLRHPYNHLDSNRPMGPGRPGEYSEHQQPPITNYLDVQLGMAPVGTVSRNPAALHGNTHVLGSNTPVSTVEEQRTQSTIV